MLKVDGLNIEAQFARGEALVLKDVSFTLRAGSPLAIIGESGSGKTMLALALLGLLPQNCFARGSASLDGTELINMKERVKNAMRGRDLIYIPQNGAEYLNPALKIKTQMYESLKKAGVKGKDALNKAALKNLNRAELGDCAQDVLDKYPHQISGGQAQRVALALSLGAQAKLVIADEPTKGIDDETARCVKECIYNEFSNAYLILITHDLKLASLARDILVLKDGEAIEYSPAEKILCDPQEKYTKDLIASMPEYGDRNA